MILWDIGQDIIQNIFHDVYDFPSFLTEISYSTTTCLSVHVFFVRITFIPFFNPSMFSRVL